MGLKFIKSYKIPLYFNDKSNNDLISSKNKINELCEEFKKINDYFIDIFYDNNADIYNRIENKMPINGSIISKQNIHKIKNKYISDVGKARASDTCYFNTLNWIEHASKTAYSCVDSNLKKEDNRESVLLEAISSNRKKLDKLKKEIDKKSKGDAKLRRSLVKKNNKEIYSYRKNIEKNSKKLNELTSIGKPVVKEPFIVVGRKRELLFIEDQSGEFDFIVGTPNANHKDERFGRYRGSSFAGIKLNHRVNKIAKFSLKTRIDEMLDNMIYCINNNEDGKYNDQIEQIYERLNFTGNETKYFKYRDFSIIRKIESSFNIDIVDNDFLLDKIEEVREEYQKRVDNLSKIDCFIEAVNGYFIIKKIKNDFYMQVSFDCYGTKKNNKDISLDSVLGVDFNISRHAFSLSDGTFIGKEISEAQNQIKNKTYSRGNKFSNRNVGKKRYFNGLKNRSNKESGKRQYIKNEFNRASKILISYAKQKNYTHIALEDLNFNLTKDKVAKNNIDQKNNKAKRRMLNNWHYRHFFNKYEEDQKTSVVRTTYVNPMFTSQKCNKCKTRGNRKSQSEFICTNEECNMFNIIVDADTNASKNIKQQGYEKILKYKE